MTTNRLYPLRGLVRVVFPAMAVITPVIFCTGCGVTLEDGYKPKVLSASPEVRKGYYASPFSDQAAAAKSDSGAGPMLGPSGPR